MWSIMKQMNYQEYSDLWQRGQDAGKLELTEEQIIFIFKRILEEPSVGWKGRMPSLGSSDGKVGNPMYNGAKDSIQNQEAWDIAMDTYNDQRDVFLVKYEKGKSNRKFHPDKMRKDVGGETNVKQHAIKSKRVQMLEARLHEAEKQKNRCEIKSIKLELDKLAAKKKDYFLKMANKFKNRAKTIAKHYWEEKKHHQYNDEAPPPNARVNAGFGIQNVSEREGRQTRMVEQDEREQGCNPQDLVSLAVQCSFNYDEREEDDVVSDDFTNPKQEQDCNPQDMMSLVVECFDYDGKADELQDDSNDLNDDHLREGVASKELAIDMY